VPGTRSSIKHWHSDEDELVYVLEGDVTLIEGDSESLLRPGDDLAPSTFNSILERAGLRRS
jgi:uncharacterized cupin superfamily protein